MNLSDKILQQIESQKVEPIAPFWHRLRSVFWFVLLGVAVVFGSQAVGLSLENFFPDQDMVRGRGFVVMASSWIPWIWAVFALSLMFLAYGAIRHFRYGYRYATAKLVGALLVSILGLGVLSSQFHLSFRVHRLLMHNIQTYAHLFEGERQKFWTSPTEGRVYGHILQVQTPNRVLVRLGNNSELWVNLASPTPMLVGGEVRAWGELCGNEFCATRLMPWSARKDNCMTK